MLAAANFANLLMHKLARLGSWRFARAFGPLGLLHCSSLWHDRLQLVRRPTERLRHWPFSQDTNVQPREMVPQARPGEFLTSTNHAPGLPEGIRSPEDRHPSGRPADRWTRIHQADESDAAARSADAGICVLRGQQLPHQLSQIVLRLDPIAAKCTRRCTANWARPWAGWPRQDHGKSTQNENSRSVSYGSVGIVGCGGKI